MSPNPPGLIAITSILSTIGTAAVIARFSVRRWKKTKYGADDWTILVGLVGQITLLENRRREGV